MIKNMESLNNLTDEDKYIVTVTVWKDQKMNTNCLVHNFPTKDLPIARKRYHHPDSRDVFKRFDDREQYRPAKGLG